MIVKNATQAEMEQAVEIVADKFQAYFLDYWNDFLTIDGYASYYGLERKEAERRIRIGRKIFKQRDLKKS